MALLTSEASLDQLMSDPHGYDCFLEHLEKVGSNGGVLRQQFLNSIGALLLALDGFEWQSWKRSVDKRATDVLSWKRISPTWKDDGPLDYAVDARGTNALHSADIGFKGTCMAELARYLSKNFEISVASFNSEQVKAMFSWALQPMEGWVKARAFDHTAEPVMVVLVFSFTGMSGFVDADPDKCVNPGRSNEMIAWSCLDYLKKYDGSCIISQWEIVTIILRSVPENERPSLLQRMRSVGTPGAFQNTSEINDLMVEVLKQELSATISKRVAVVAHPDHIPRAYKTMRSTLDKLDGELGSTISSIELIPGIFPYSLDWPKMHCPGLLAETNRTGSIFNFFQDEHYTLLDQQAYGWFQGDGELEGANFYRGLGYFPEGDPHKWVQSRRTFIMYELWARAKFHAVGIL